MTKEDDMIKSINEIVKNKKFNIPNLQRSYVWTEIEWEQLWEDICRVYNAVYNAFINDNKSQEQHFMGCLVLKENDIQCDTIDGTTLYDIIDGQQRFTTLKILMDYLFDLKNYPGESTSNSGDYIQIENINTPKQDGIMDESKESEKEPYTKVYNYYAAKYNMVAAKWNLNLLIDIIQNRFYFMVRELTEGENKNDVFEAINATGKPLQFGDLILNYLCELNHESKDPLEDCVIRKEWKSICVSVYNNELLETAPVIDALKIEDEEEKETKEAEDEIEDENEELDIDDTEKQDDEDFQNNCEAEKEIKENPLKLKKFLNALHCLTLPQTKSMPESIDAFEEIFKRLKNSKLDDEKDNSEDELTAKYILSQMENWLEYYLAYLNPQSCKEKKYYCDELYYLSILGNTSIIPVVMRTLKKYKDSKDDCQNILYGITCCQIIKNVYLERDNTHEMDKKSILADYLYESVQEKDKKNIYLNYLVNIEKLRNGLKKDLQNLDDRNYNDIELYKVPYNKKICKFLLAISYNQKNLNSKKKLIEKENEKKIIAAYIVSPDERDKENKPVYLSLGYNGKTVNELWNIVLREEGSSSECVTFTDCKEEYVKRNLQRLQTILTSIGEYCKKILNLSQIGFEEKFFVEFILKDNMFLAVKGCNCKEEDIKREEDEKGKKEDGTKKVYFGFKNKNDKWHFTTSPENYFRNNDTIAYYLNGKLVEGENENETGNKKTALLALLNVMKENVGKDNIREMISSMTRTYDKNQKEVSEKTSNLIYITKNILDQYEKEKQISESTKKRWCSYLEDLGKDDITVNLNTGVQVITKEVRRIYKKYMEIPNPQEKDRKIGFCLKMRRPEMHYIKGVRKLTQYRNLADKEEYEKLVLDEEKKQVNMDSPKKEHSNSLNTTYQNLNNRYFSATSMTIADIIQKYKLSVPEYQRNYVWDENNWEALIQSIGKNEELNLGSIILYKKNEDVASIVDGQQRLTTIFTLLNCLDDKNDYQIVKENKDEAMNEKCKKYMEKYVKDCKNRNIDIIKIKEKVKNIKVYVLTIDCADPLYQYRVFSSVNGKGKKLSVEEKVKNYLFKKIGEGKTKEVKKIASDKGFIKAYSERREKAHVAESKLYEKFKECIEKEKNLTTLLTDLNNERNLYVFLKTGNVVSDNDKKEKDPKPIIKEFWIWLKLYQHLKVDTADALLLDILCKNISDIQHLKKLSIVGENIENLQFTVKLLKQIDMIYFLLYVDDQNGNGKKSINSKFPRIVGMDDIRIRMKVEEKNNTECIINEPKEVDLILDDPALYNKLDIKTQVDHIWEKIKETDLTRTMRVNVSRYLLMMLEIWNGMDMDTAFSMLTEKTSKNITKLANCDVEHIFPANPDKEYEELKHPEYLYMLENVCLLESNINRSKTLSNGMMVMEKMVKDDKVKSKLGYIKNGTFVFDKSKYSGSELGFPKMFYDKEKPNKRYLSKIKNSNTDYYYCNEGAEERLKDIKKNIANNNIFFEMLESVLPKDDGESDV